MNLSIKIRNDIICAIKEKNNEVRDTLRRLLSEIQLRKENPNLTDDDITSIIIKSVKRRDEAIFAGKQANRNVDKEIKEKEILIQYLPKQLAHWEVNSIITEVITESRALSKKDLGKVMRVLIPRIEGKFDITVAKDMVLERLK